MDSEGCDRGLGRKLKRRVYTNPGPNHSWHIDGYDKLKPDGFAIHGCIDGYIRKIIWLRLNRANNNPVVIARYYIDALKEHEGCPSKVFLRILSHPSGSISCKYVATACLDT